MENHWNLKILYETEDVWREDIMGLPRRVEEIRRQIRSYEKKPEQTGQFLKEMLGELEQMIRISARAEIWLSRMTALHPVDPYYAQLSDRLDRQEQGELPLMKEIRHVLREIPDLPQVLEEAGLSHLVPWAAHLCRRILVLETLDSEPGGGWYRLMALMEKAQVDYQGETVTWRELQEENGYAEWGEEMHVCLRELCRAMYEKYGEPAADILLDVLRRDEEDYRREGSDSLTVYLLDHGFSREALRSMLQAVEEGLEDWYRCKRSLDRWVKSLQEDMAGEHEGAEDEPEEEEQEEGASEEEDEAAVDARNREAYEILRDTILEQFREFHPGFRKMVEESFAGDWVWINDDPLAYMDQHCSMVPETGVSYISLAADCYLPAAAHELGHAWFNRCIREQNILYAGNDLMTEVPANLAALWSYRWTIEHRYDTLRQLEETGTSPEIVEAYRRRLDSPAVYEELLTETVSNLYDGYAAFCFEQELRSRILEEPLTAEDISAMYLKYRRKLLLPENCGWELDPFRWLERHNLFTCRSYYNLPYILSMLAAWRFLDAYDACQGNEERRDYWERMSEFLWNMNVEPAQENLERFFGEDVQGIEFWRKCMKPVREFFGRIEKMCGEAADMTRRM